MQLAALELAEQQQQLQLLADHGSTNGITEREWC
jgi:hypothetical protein